MFNGPPPPSHICNIIQVIRCQRFFFLFCFFLSWQMAERLDWWIADLICISYSVYSFSFCPELFLYFMNIINFFTCFFNYSFLCSFKKKKKKNSLYLAINFDERLSHAYFLGDRIEANPLHKQTRQWHVCVLLHNAAVRKPHSFSTATIKAPILIVFPAQQ